MREIKFRAWTKNLPHSMYYWDDGFNYRWFDRSGQKYVELMQYTGLKDQNGKDIYEGDIIQTDWPTMRNSSDVWVVEFGHTGMYQLYPPSMHSFKESIHDLVYNKWKLEVLGNIYENPELLK